jgi:hypothetical protein
MGTPRQSVTRISGPLVAILAITIVAFIIFVASHSYLLAISTLLILGTGYGIYVLGVSSGLPGTSGRGGRNVRP